MARQEASVCGGRRLEVIAGSMDYFAAERLQPNVIAIVGRLAAHGQLVLTGELRRDMSSTSVCTVRRILQRGRQTDRHCVLRWAVSECNRVAAGIPTRRIVWNEPESGHFEADLVHHGDPVDGSDYVHTLQLVDVAAGWSERVAIPGRSDSLIEGTFRRILARRPSAVREIHADNGSEFLNDHLLRFWSVPVVPPTVSRSGPWWKNDNRFVEQENHTLVSAFLG